MCLKKKKKPETPFLSKLKGDIFDNDRGIYSMVQNPLQPLKKDSVNIICNSMDGVGCAHIKS
jgi:hypothetical protein